MFFQVFITFFTYGIITEAQNKFEGTIREKTFKNTWMGLPFYIKISLLLRKIKS